MNSIFIFSIFHEPGVCVNPGLEARTAHPRLPDNIIRQGYTDVTKRLRVRRHPALTPNQQAVLRHELMIQDDRITVARRAVFELLQTVFRPAGET